MLLFLVSYLRRLTLAGKCQPKTCLFAKLRSLVLFWWPWRCVLCITVRLSLLEWHVQILDRMSLPKVATITTQFQGKLIRVDVDESNILESKATKVLQTSESLLIWECKREWNSSNCSTFCVCSTLLLVNYNVDTRFRGVLILKRHMMYNTSCFFAPVIRIFHFFFFQRFFTCSKAYAKVLEVLVPRLQSH